MRVVYQFGQIDYIVARGSTGPITNLHLNNKPIEVEKIGLSEEHIKEISEICKNTMSCFDGLNVAGIDILVTPNKRFKVIEINSQGDLIYADIKAENTIYKNQVKHYCE